MLRVRQTFSGVQGAPWLSTMFFTTATEDASSAAAAVTAVGAFWTAIRSLMTTSVTWATQAQVDGIDVNGNHTGAWSTTPATNSGSAATNQLPQAVQMLCQWRTGTYVNNREVRGRTFIPGLVTGAMASTGLVLGTASTTVQTAINTLLGNATVHLCVWDRTHAGSAQVTSGTVWNQFAILRSRRD